MDKILAITTEYGLPVLVIACAIIFIIGLLKLCKVFDKIQSKGLKKFLYYALDIILSFVGIFVYFKIANIEFAWLTYIKYSVSQLTVTVALYAFYESVHIRTFVQFLIKCVATWLKKNPNSTIAKNLKKLGLDAAAIERVQKNVTAEAEIAKQKTTQTK
jgi:hypothetical protein